MARHSDSVIDFPKSAESISRSVGADEQPAKNVAVKRETIFFMATLSAVRLANNNRPMKIRQQGLGSEDLGAQRFENVLFDIRRPADARMIWLTSAVLSVVVIVTTYWVAPATASLGSAEPAGFLLLWTRYSAHLAFVFLILAFSASTLKRYYRNTLSTYLMRHRRQIGLGFATAHFAHLTALSLFLGQLEGFAVDASTAVAGFGYAVLLALTLTSNDWSVRQMGIVAWRRLHTAGISILMLYFFVAFSARLVTQGGALYGLYVFLIVLAVSAKVWIKRKTRVVSPG